MRAALQRGARIGRPQAAVDQAALVQVHPARCGGVHIRPGSWCREVGGSEARLGRGGGKGLLGRAEKT